MTKKPQKTKQEKQSESFFPIDETSLKYSTEKKVKQEKPKQDILKRSIEKKYSKPETNTLEKIEKKSKNFRKRKQRKKTRTITKKVKYVIPKIQLKEKGYELIITEKPQAASKIANALGKAVQKNYLKIPYFEVDRDGKKIVVVCAVGHLFTLKQNKPGSKVPEFDVSWVPNYLARKKDFTKRYYDTILKIAKNAGSLTVATDFDIEGEVIGLNIVRFICNQKDASRMKFSTLTKEDLNKAYESKFKHLKWGQAIAGETRHYLDWFYGINLSRALMNAVKTTGKFRIMSIGRVQGPALNLIVKKEREINKFKPETFYQVFITIYDSKNKLELKHNKDIFNKKDLEKFENLKGKKCLAQTKKTEQIVPPHFPFNLTNLQTEAYKFYGLTPSRTLQIAQSLYLSGLISYPRTSSQKLPKEIGYDKILKELLKKFKFKKLIKKQNPIEGKKTDPAHPSIYPTGNFMNLSGDDKKIYELIVKRFISLFCEDAIIDKKRITTKVGDLLFSTNGSQIRKKAWMEVYPYKLKENEIPDFDGEVEIIDSRIEQKQTQPPKRFSPASILSELEKRNLGTKATRASILETLYDRNYIKGKSIEATPLGMSLIKTLEEFSPIIIDEELTRNFENEMQEITKAKKGFVEKEKKVIEEVKKTITDISKDFEKNEKEIGKELVEANIKFREQQKRENRLITCPKCGKGNLGITYSKKTRRFFVACDAYPNCKNTYSLPPNGIIKKTDKVCEKCGWPMLMRLAKGRKPWIFCFNPNCETNAEWASAYAKRQKEKDNNDERGNEQSKSAKYKSEDNSKSETN